MTSPTELIGRGGDNSKHQKAQHQQHWKGKRKDVIGLRLQPVDSQGDRNGGSEHHQGS